ncbi:hypothetical protein SCB71_01800 [Herbiconiux sp. KACC 21604]|uniref:hypothetical protein n=1 Tax=unclassified Herbiconiux TaxID=2618217 RepID=UPI001491B992|nr:hypothetical protein [Herbiconiux sp. SALV-R1]QJU55788.1 hypothetical protein HL652_20660 [Herbiconiux sp. SALV-R1]WPO86999.1 hypothetical protein SCB71_01800 [Herbiconiux sp. KACC 21604]
MISAGDGIDTLENLGVRVRPSGPRRAVLQLPSRSVTARVITRQHPLKPVDLGVLGRLDPDEDAVLVVVPRLTPAGRRLAAEHPDLIVVAVEDGTALVEGDELRPVMREDAPTLLRRRKPWGRFALMRSLLRTPEPRDQATLAAESGITQSAVSQGLKVLDHVERRESGWVCTNPEKLWDSFLADYPGAGGLSGWWFGLAPVVQQAARVTSEVETSLLSGDLAADALAPWRRPRRGVIYVGSGVELEAMGLARSRESKATLEVTIPADPTIWSTARAWASGGDRDDLADPLLAAWDVARTGGPDADEAVERLRTLVLARW